MKTELNKIAIHSVPRSGSTWLGEIFNSSPHTIYRYQPLFSYALKDYLSNSSSREDIESFFAELVKIKDDDFMNQAAHRKKCNLPTFKKLKTTHVIYKEVRYINILPNLLRKATDVKVAILIRNPLAVINSWLGIPKEFRKDHGWKELEEWRYALKRNQNKPQEFFGYEKWRETTLLFHQLKLQYPDRMQIVKYSDLLNNTTEIVKDLFGAFDIEMTEQTRDFIKTSSEKTTSDPYSVYRKKQTDDKWKEQLNPEIIEAILEDVKDTELEQYID
jgi:hypothetical protein